MLLVMWASECACYCGSGLAWVVGDAEELPFDDDQFDVYTIAFGIRNVTHIEQVSDSVITVWWDLGGKTHVSRTTGGFLTNLLTACVTMFIGVPHKFSLVFV